MKFIDTLVREKITRRNFLSWMAKAAAASSLYPLAACSSSAKPKLKDPSSAGDVQPAAPSPQLKQVVVGGSTHNRVLLKSGLIVDGTGSKAFVGSVLMNGDGIEMVIPNEIVFSGKTIDCSGKVIAPGFIDAHSHMDETLPIRGHSELKNPFTAQGVTSFVTGNCGFGVAGTLKDSPHKEFNDSLLQARTYGLLSSGWDSMGTYFDYLNSNGISHNMANLAGHGVARTSIRGFKPTPLDSEEMRLLLKLLEEAMDDGAYGVSLGLQYEPGVFSTNDELKQIARLVKKKDKILTVHLRAYSSLSGTYPLKLFGRPHNLIALEEMLNLARETGVRLQVSHLIFVGTKSWETYEEGIALIDRAIDDGVDVKFDTYAYHCGVSIINVFMPKWFLADLPEAYDSRWALFKLDTQLQLVKTLLGFGFDDIQITNAQHPDLNRYNGMFLTDIAAARQMMPFKNFIDFAEKSEGKAAVLNHRYSNLEIIKAMMQHPAVLFMTDAKATPEGVQNPGAFGNFPLFLQYARDYRLISLEEAVHKMTGATAERFQIKDRGILKKGYAADITVFDWNTITDNNTAQATSNAPTGIEAVFINGQQVLDNGNVKGSALPGKVL